VYCPDHTAIDAGAVAENTFSGNFVSGEMKGVTIDDRRFRDGGDIAAAFVGPTVHNFQPRADSVLLGTADPAFVPPDDLNRQARTPPHDVGAYQGERADAGQSR
jgi:hypothetical protein